MRKAVGGREAMQDRVRAIRLSLSNPTRSLLKLRTQLQRASQESFEGDNYVSLIPLVTREDGARTNVGLNNFSRFSVHKGPDPVASVAIGLYDPSGNLDRRGFFDVRSNGMNQFDVFRRLRPVDGGGAATTGWLLIFSDEPITAWASVILDRVSNDPAMELAIADQILKPAAYVESQGTPFNPLLIQSSAGGGSFKSRLAVVNIGTGAGRLRIKLLNNAGHVQESLAPVDIPANGMFVDNDIRSMVPGTSGPIVIEVEDLNPEFYDEQPRIVATSLVESTTGPFAGFFPAFALPQPDNPAIAGVWEGDITGDRGIMNAQVRVTLHQERDMLYGVLEILSGAFPTLDREFLIEGEVVNGSIKLEIENFFDAPPSRDALPPFVGFRLFAEEVEGQMMSGDSIYFDEMDRFDKGNFELTRVSAVYPPEE